jgi:hypothetical protein
LAFGWGGTPPAAPQPADGPQPAGTQLQVAGAQQVVGTQHPGGAQQAAGLAAPGQVGCMVQLLFILILAAERQPLPNQQTGPVQKGRKEFGGRDCHPDRVRRRDSSHARGG